MSARDEWFVIWIGKQRIEVSLRCVRDVQRRAIRRRAVQKITHSALAALIACNYFAATNAPQKKKHNKSTESQASQTRENEEIACSSWKVI